MNAQEFPLNLVADVIVLPAEIQSFLNKNPFLFDFLKKAKEEIPKNFTMDFSTKLFLDCDNENRDNWMLLYCVYPKCSVEEASKCNDAFLDFWTPEFLGTTPERYIKLIIAVRF